MYLHKCRRHLLYPCRFILYTIGRLVKEQITLLQEKRIVHSKLLTQSYHLPLQTVHLIFPCLSGECCYIHLFYPHLSSPSLSNPFFFFSNSNNFIHLINCNVISLKFFTEYTPFPYGVSSNN